MMMRCNSLIRMAVLLVLSGAAQADQRVLFQFDDAGVQIYRVMQLDEQSDFSQPSRAKGLVDGVITMTWLDVNGDALGSSDVADPRVTHSPNHTDSFIPSRLGLLSGGWVASAPDDAASVIVELPEKPALGLAAETWTLPLSRSQ